ncbi:MAG TPA: uroporphyrinogen-III synthase [Candidatus Krumholzibacteria bacterium]|nr:uroporphyrinogen-III synthase [Candidatus Krumholzibacteria bacterium]
MTAGRRIVLTREAQQIRPWAERLRAAGHDVCELPLLRYVALAGPGDVPTGGVDWIVFTSPHAVEAFFAVAAVPATAQVACLGAGTRTALLAAGGRDALGLECRDGVELAAAFTARVAAPAAVLLPGSAKRLAEPRRSLEAAGFAVTEIALYDTGAVPADELPPEPCAAGDVVFFASPTAVGAFAGAWHVRPDCVAIGETTATAAREAGFPVTTAATPDLEAMVLAAGLDPIPAPATPRSGS